MGLREKTITYEHENLGEIELVVGEASVLMGMARTRLSMMGRAAKEEDPDRALLLTFSYPDVIAATKSAEGLPSWPLSFDDFLELPESLLVEWEAVVYELNPGWLLTGQKEDGEEAQKKATSSTED